MAPASTDVPPMVSERMADGPWAGWIRWTDPTPDTFLAVVGPSYARAEQEGRATVMLETRPLHSNRLGGLHGGFLSGFADHAYFAALNAMGRPEMMNGLTVDLTMQYLGSSRVGPPIAAAVDLLRETGRMIFLRLLVTQEGAAVAASSATVRKPRAA